LQALTVSSRVAAQPSLPEVANGCKSDKGGERDYASNPGKIIPLINRSSSYLNTCHS